MDKKTIYCPRFRHFKDVLVCRINCPVSRKCPVFRELEKHNRADLEARLEAYLAAHPNRYARLFYLEVIHTMKDEMFLVLDAENKPHLLKREDVLQRAEKGERFKGIYKISQEMELRYQLVPKAEGAQRKSAKAPAKP